jgi:phage-related protein
VAVGSVIGEAFIEVKPRTENFGPQTEKGVSSGLGKAAKTAAVAFGSVLAADAAVHFVSGFVKAANESQKISRVTDAVIKSTGAAAGLSSTQIGSLATSLSNLTGIDDEVIQSGENVLLTFTNVRDAAGLGNDIFSRTSAAALDMAAVLGGDPQAQILALGKALNSPAEGLTKLTRSGITFTEQQKDQVKQLQASGDLLGAQKIVLDEVNREFGGAAAAAADPFERLSVVMGNLQEAIGGALIPVLAPAAAGLANLVTAHTDDIAGALTGVLHTLGSVIGFLKPGVENLAGAFKFLFEKFSDLAEKVGGFLADHAPNISGFFEHNTPLAEGLSTAIVGIATAFGGLAVAGAASSSLAGPISTLGALGSLIGGLASSPAVAGLVGIVGAFAAAAAAGELLFQKVDLVHDAFEGLFGKTIAPFAAALTFLNPFVPLAAAAKFLYDNVQPVHDAIDGLVGVVSGLAGTAVDFVQGSGLADFFASISDALGSIDLSGIADTLGPVFAQIGAVAATVGGAISGGFATAVQAIRSAIGPAVQFLTDLWGKYGDQVTGILVGFRDIAVAVFERAAALVGVFAGQLVNAANLIVDVAGPAFEFIGATVQIAIAPLGAVISGALTAAQTAFETFVGVVGPMWSALWGLMSDVVSAVIGPISDIIEGVLGVIQGFVDIVAGLMTLDWSRVWDGVGEIVGSALEIVQGVLEALLGFLGAVWSNAGTLITLPFTTAQTIIEGVVSIIGTVIQTALQGAVDFVTTVWANIGTLLTAPIEIAKAVIDGLIAGIVTLFTALPGQVTDALKAFPTLLVDLGTKLIEGLKSGIDSAWTAVSNFFTGLGGTIAGLVGDLSTKLTAAGLALINGFGAAIDAAFGAIIHFAQSLGSAIAGFVGDLSGVLVEAGASLIRGFIHGIESVGASAVETAIKAAISPAAAILGGLGIDIPGVPFIASGAVIPGPFSQGMLAVVHGSEVVLNPQQQANLLFNLANMNLPATFATDSGDRAGGVAVDARIINNGTIIGIDDLQAMQDQQAERLADIVSSGRRGVPA